MRALVLAFALAAVPPWACGQSANELLAEADRQLDLGQPVDALRTLRKAQALGADGAALLVGFGELYVAVSELDRAKSSFLKGLELAKDDGDAAARALNGIARIDLAATRYTAAGEALSRARARSAASDRTRADTLVLSAELSARSGSLAEARRLAAQALQVAQRRSPIGEARATAQLAGIAARAASYREAFAGWEQALAQLRRLHAARDVAEALVNLGDLYAQFGLAREAKERHEEALQQFSQMGNHAGEARALVRLARAERRLLRPDLAIKHADAALDIARRRHDYVTEAEALVELGEIWIGDPVPAMPALPSPEVAQRHLRAAREIYKDAGDRGASGYVWLKSGAILLRARQFTVAAKTFEYLVGEARTLQDEELLWQALRGHAAALAGRGDLDAAATRYVEAIDALERVYERTSGLSQEARGSFLGDRRGIYEEYVEVLILLRRGGGGADLDALAFGASERAKSRQFTEMVMAAGAERSAGAADARLRELVELERAMRVDLAQVAAALAGPGGRGEPGAALAAQAAALRGRHEETMRRIESAYPRFAELLRPKPLALSAVQAVLQPREALVSYFVGARFTAAFVVTRERFTMIPLEITRQQLRLAADRLRRPFAELSSFAELANWKPAEAQALYAQVFQPLAGFIAPGMTVHIAADDILYTVPFEAFLRSAAPATDPAALSGPADSATRSLVIARPAEGAAAPGTARPAFAEMASLDWLGDLYAFTYIPSASALRALRAEDAPRGWKVSLVAFADPDFGDGSPSSEARWVGRSSVLARLPETADEARAVAGIVGGETRIFLQRDASESKLAQSDLMSARYLMFSTHGLLGGEVSAVAEPALALSMVGNPLGIDGFLSMSEVLALRLGADLVVLSACNTAGEPNAARIGEGFAGLTRSFMYAGARSLVVSHWPVGSQATVALMTAFFEELKSGKPKPVALAAARKRLRAVVQNGISLSHPFFWAPFVIVGDPS